MDGKKIISQWAPENSKNYESLQPSTENDIAKNLFNKGNIYLQNSLINSLKVLLSLQEKIPVVSQPEKYKERVVFPAINKVYDDDFELQVKPIKTAQSNSHSSVKSEVSSKASITKKSAKLLPDVGNISGFESTPPERTNSVSTTPSTSSSVEDYPRKKRKFGKIKIKNKKLRSTYWRRLALHLFLIISSGNSPASAFLTWISTLCKEWKLGRK
ncbi:Nej1p [Saccharomyces cerevisiae x Saccharomyces kudriavzevii VIN7]|uniref:Nej1p n=1 Tax=Saccharomyces cerevisiae x Saccharomyces kudriavzevii (strain VIN7) TaxID=1095631 RepID=H0GYF7_SACCK|nr:Nej1p [Saccharomyces cerevisiae x Saccharomyces kudriavzevii VIN7]